MKESRYLVTMQYAPEEAGKLQGSVVIMTNVDGGTQTPLDFMGRIVKRDIPKVEVPRAVTPEAEQEKEATSVADFDKPPAVGRMPLPPVKEPETEPAVEPAPESPIKELVPDNPEETLADAELPELETPEPPAAEPPKEETPAMELENLMEFEGPQNIQDEKPAAESPASREADPVLPVSGDKPGTGRANPPKFQAS